MIGSLKIGTAFGIPIRIHWTFLFLFYVPLLQGASPLVTVAAVAVVFGCVLLHELGHSLVARGFGIRVVDITFWPLGGMARMTEIPENSRIEALVAIAGPAVNFALAGLAVLAAIALEVVDLAGAPFCVAFAVANGVQGAFNLLPAFPMDGGRLLRALLARNRDWLDATELAVRVGRIVAALMFFAAVVLLRAFGVGLWLLVLVPLFVWFAGARELFGVRLRHGVFPFGAPGGAPGRPSTQHTSTARAAAAESAAPCPPPSPGPEEGAANGARRPSSFDPRLLNGGFDDEAVRKMEAFRGRIHEPREEPS